MCLALPGKIVSIEDKKAVVNFGGVKRQVDLSFLADARIGEWVLVHVGFAIQKVDEKSAYETYHLLAKMDKEALDREINELKSSV